MSLLSGSFSVRRFGIRDWDPGTEAMADFRARVSAGLRRYAWRPINADRGEKTSIGFVDALRATRVPGTFEEVAVGGVLLLGVRIDTKNIPSPVKEAAKQDLFEQVKAEKGVQRLSRQHRLALSEQVENELLVDESPSVAVVPVLLDMAHGDVWIGTAATSTSSRIMDLLMSAFDFNLSVYYPSEYIAEKSDEHGFKPRLCFESLTTRLFRNFVIMGTSADDYQDYPDNSQLPVIAERLGLEWGVTGVVADGVSYSNLDYLSGDVLQLLEINQVKLSVKENGDVWTGTVCTDGSLKSVTLPVPKLPNILDALPMRLSALRDFWGIWEEMLDLLLRLEIQDIADRAEERKKLTTEEAE
jgi:hypothetical protein